MTPVPPAVASDLAEILGMATSLASSGRHDAETYLAALAREVCTPRQCEAIRLSLGGAPTSEVGAAMGVTAGAVDCLLYGTMRKGVRSGGAVARLRDALHERNMTTLSDIPTSDPPVTPRGLPPTWYHDALRPPDPTLFAALGLLALCLHLSDRKGDVDFAELARSVPPTVLTACLPRLRIGGYIAYTGGATLRVLRTPEA